MSAYTIKKLDEIPDVFEGRYPGSMRMMTQSLGAEQVAFTHRHMPPKSGGKGGYGHRHRTQEEIYFVLSGVLQFKLGDDVIDVPAGCAVRVPASTWRSVWNDKPDDAELVIVSTKADDPAEAEAELLENFWPE